MFNSHLHHNFSRTFFRTDVSVPPLTTFLIGILIFFFIVTKPHLLEFAVDSPRAKNLFPDSLRRPFECADGR